MENTHFKKFWSAFSKKTIIFITVGAVLLSAVIVFLVFKDSLFPPETLEESPFASTAELALAREKLAAGGSTADVLATIDSRPYKVQLSFDGLRNQGTMDYILQLLDESGVPAIFFVSANDATEKSDVLLNILDDGHAIGNYGVDGAANLDSLSEDELIDLFVKSQKIITVVSGVEPDTFKCYHTEYTEDILRCASAAGLDSAIDNTYTVDLWSFSSYSSVLRFVNEKPYGSFISFRILDDVYVADESATAVASPTVDKPAASEVAPAVDKQQTILPDADKVDMSVLDYEGRVKLIAQWLIQAVQEATFVPESVDLCESNAGRLAESAPIIYTIAPNVCYLFSNLGNDAELEALLEKLKDLDAPSTFFVTHDDLTEHADEIHRIIEGGHAIGISIQPSSKVDVYTVCSELLLCKNQLASDFGYEDATLVIQLSDTVSDIVREAVSAAGMQFVSYQTGIVTDAQTEFSDPQEVIDSIFGTKTYALTRGQCVYFAMNVYADPALLAGVVEALQSEKTTYQPETVYTLLSDTDSLYTYPVATDDVLDDLATAIYPGHITSDEQFYDLVYNYYIGTPDIDNWRFMPGFTAEEVARIDKGGRVFSNVNSGRVAYLTFDDWGSDIAITELLDVLDKYDVKATFFIRTNYVESNPNLLRAIAAAGHDIASHTDQHYSLSNATDKAKVYASLTDEQLVELQQDVITSWDKLVSIIGDVSYEGNPVLQKMFRSPTLSVSKGGLNVVFDLGFDYIVGGSYPSPDYNISSARALYVRLERNLYKGAILIMHMLDSADNTAQALDLLLAANSRLPKDEQYVFLKLSDSLDGTYTNANRGN